MTTCNPGTSPSGACCIPDVKTSKRFGGESFESGATAAVDSFGNMIIAGVSSSSEIDFGGGPLPGSVGDIFIAKLDGAGNHLWSRRFESDGVISYLGVASDGAGDLVMAGSFSGTIDFGTTTLTCATGRTLFAVKLDVGGSFVWAKSYGNGEAFIPQVRAKMDGDGNIFLAGYAHHDIDFGAFVLSIGGGSAFLVKLDGGGTPMWGNVYGKNAPIYVGLSANNAGDVALVSDLDGPIDVGGGPVGCYNGSIVMKVNGSGDHLWSKGICADYGPAIAESVTLGKDGSVVLAGIFAGYNGTTTTLDVGGQPLVSVGDYDIFVAKLDGDGGHLWSKSFGTTGFDVIHGVSSNTSSDVAISGIFHVPVSSTTKGPVDLGCGPIGNGEELFLAELDGEGNFVWSASYGAVDDSYGAGPIIDEAGRVVLVGNFSGTVDLGAGPLTSNGGSDMFLLKL